MKTVEEIFAALFQDDVIAAVNLELDTLSYPVPARAKNRIVEKFFVTANQPYARRGRPYASFTVDTDSGALLQYVVCEYEDFAAETGVDLQQELDYSAPMEGDYQSVFHAKQQFNKAYSELRSFVFRDKLNKEQTAIVREYASLHAQLISKDLEAFYKCLSPEYYSWIHSVLQDQDRN